MKKILIFVMMNIFLFSQLHAANIDKFSEKIFISHQNENIFNQAEIYEKYISQLEKIIQNNPKTTFINNIIELEKNISIKHDEIISEILQKKAKIKTGNTLILKFSNTTNISQYVLNNSQKIKDSNSVFIFRESENLTSKNMKKITWEIKNISDDILIFIDQEWGQINRFISFENWFSLEKYTDYLYVFFRFNALSSQEKENLKQLFWNSQYFPSMWNIWKFYKNISKENKQNFLEIITFIQLKNLQNHWINTHWFIADLDLWNPVISGLNRSFSENILDYFDLINAYIEASKVTWVVLYAKHFPGHGAGKIDSHSDILDYSQNTQYVENNLLVFEYFLENTKLLWKWIMVWHMYLDKNISDKFHKIIDKSDFIITDDLAMEWFKKIKNIPENKIFSTQEILQKNNLIKVHTQENIWIK